jgi:hypothetical protein
VACGGSAPPAIDSCQKKSRPNGAANEASGVAYQSAMRVCWLMSAARQAADLRNIR